MAARSSGRPSTVAGAARVMAADALLVMVRAFRAAVEASFLLDSALRRDDADAISAGALYRRHFHRFSPVKAEIDARAVP